MTRQYTYALLGIVIGFSLFPISEVAATVLKVPFTSQAPFGDWRQPWQDACEEAVITMADAYYAGNSLDRSSGRDGILRALRIKEGVFGPSLDEGSEKMVQWINNFFPWEARAVTQPTLEQIKQEIDAGRPVIALAHGRTLRNPYFQGSGPDYHTIILSGYDDQRKEFITQEPGTFRGLDFRYSYDRIMNAIHDFVPGKKTITGKKVVLFTTPTLTTSGQLDGDRDGLSKQDELRFGTILWLRDSDGDGYDDGAEVRLGYLPTVNESAYPDGSLVKAIERPEVYLVQRGVKRHIANEQVFLRNGWQWTDIRLASDTFLSSLASGSPIDR